LIYTILVVLAIVLLVDAGEAIIRGHVKPPHMAAFVAGVVAVFLNYVLSSYGFCAGNRLNSPSMIANANENRSDMLSSIAVVLGILGANLGFPVLDSVAAVLVALIIFRTGLTLWLQAFRNLLDQSLPFEKIKLIRDFILQYKAVRDISFLTTRRVGQTVWADIEIVVSPEMNVQEGFSVAREIRLALIRRFRHIKDAMVTCTCKENPFIPGHVKKVVRGKHVTVVSPSVRTVSAAV
jgi:cation diffusion facilitator family transporter